MLVKPNVGMESLAGIFSIRSIGKSNILVIRIEENPVYMFDQIRLISINWITQCFTIDFICRVIRLS